MKVIEEKDFDEEIKSGRVIVDFFATWCMPCKMMGQIFERMEDNLDSDVKIVKVDVDESETVSRKFGVLSIPTLVFFKDGEMFEKHVGLMQEDQVLDILEKMK